MEARLLVRGILGKFGVFWSKLDAEIYAFQIHFVTTTYGDGAMAEGKEDF